MNRKSSLLQFLALLVSLCCSLLIAQTPNANEYKTVRDSIIQQTILLTHQEKYDSVFKNADQLIEKFPQDPSGYFLKANAYQTRMRDYRVNIYEAEFDSLINLAVEISKHAVERNPIAENYFLYGASEGYRCLYRFRTGKWLKAIGAAIKSSKMLHKALEKNPDFVDPLLGLAVYDYGKSKVQLLGVGLFSDKTEQIINDLNKVYEQSRFLSFNALFSLQLIYCDADSIEKLKEVNKKLILKFPNHPVCHYYRALALEELDSLQEARENWLFVLNKIENFDPSSNNYLAECNYHLAKIAYLQGEKTQARAYIREAARHIRQYKEEEEINGALYTYDDIRKQIEDALNTWDLNW